MQLFRERIEKQDIRLLETRRYAGFSEAVFAASLRSHSENNVVRLPGGRVCFKLSHQHIELEHFLQTIAPVFSRLCR
jgi:hypothetical protein